VIHRDPVAAAASDYDLVVVGGGIYGACLAYEAARHGLRTLLLEKGDFGEATSWNSFRVLHGGFRYLQRLDASRVRQSVLERRWFLRHFPELVQPLDCLVPLYGDGRKRPLFRGAALAVNELLSYDRNAGVRADRRLPRGRVLTAEETIRRCPPVERRDLQGAGVWYDAAMAHPQRVLIGILHWACSLGATALNYLEATRLVTDASGVSAVEARDTRTGRAYRFGTRAVCNCAGPWSAEVATRFENSVAELFRPSLAFNVLLDCPQPTASALAVAPRRSGGDAPPVYFLYPAFGGLFAGTAHLPWRRDEHRDPLPTEAEVERFLADVNAALPGLGLRSQHVVRVFSGLLPVSQAGTTNLARRPVIWDHGRQGGTRGLVSVSGVKFTTARLVAEQALATLGPYLGAAGANDDSGPPDTTVGLDLDRPRGDAFGDDEIAALTRLVREEAVMTIDDLLCRRLGWGTAAPDYGGLAARVEAAIGTVMAPEHPRLRSDDGPPRSDGARMRAS
jgi:glycerol-3-phosphate dehydrogenase